MAAKVAAVITRLATAEWSPEREVSPGKRTSASDTSGTEGWLRSARAAEARSAPKPTRDGLDSGGNGSGMLYLHLVPSRPSRDGGQPGSCWQPLPELLLRPTNDLVDPARLLDEFEDGSCVASHPRPRIATGPR